jgi:2-polyprenyl-3-methyl-5-hydroxy-6-metoxy-1,4-benzoquinol methylase
MNISSYISNRVVEKEGVAFLAERREFAYSDGNRAEQYVLDVIRNATDISSNSRELEAGIKDWPSRYHLSRERANAYRSLAIPEGASILEVGCGCGSITRLLGERGARVLAVEGSPRRAAIARARTRDLPGVTVLCASFDEVAFASTFDIVVCNGVLEYAAMFVAHQHPHEHLISLLAPLVAPAGSLIVAIENQLGLRYFSSGREEHVNIMFDGLEGYAARPGGARTFGVRELRGLLAGQFQSVETCLPLPDYKLPVALVRADLVDRVSCAELFANTAAHDFESHVMPLMHERMVWRELDRNGLLTQFANSLFMIAGAGRTSLLGAAWMGDIYSSSRAPQFDVRTRISCAADGAVVTEKSYCHQGDPPGAAAQLRHVLSVTPWRGGVSIHTLVARALMRRGKVSLRERLRAPVELWWRAVMADASLPDSVPGTAIDRNWQNILVERGAATAIDNEWVWSAAVEPGWLIFRTVMKFWADERPYFPRWYRATRGLTPYALMCASAAIIGVRFGVGELRRAAASEREFRELTCGSRWRMSKLVLRAFEPRWLASVRLRLRALPMQVRRWLVAVVRRAVRGKGNNPCQ